MPARLVHTRIVTSPAYGQPREPLLSFDVLADPITELEREEVASEPRHWVRISRTCNNHCVFCLDSDVQDGTFVARDEVEREIDQGLAQGATRLILSGGEATIHPDFLHFVELAKRRGYGHVQTITNGRMFAYRDFAARAVAAGLDEVTFSLHGHTPELSDELTGVPGSFAQTVAGIRNVVATGRCIVSGDVVVSRRNVRHLRSVLELFVSLGIREFDVLMVVPFGRSSPGDGDDMLFDAAHEIEHIHEALDLSHDPSLHVWTNRMDPRLLEGYENLIQDPHKLHDEVRGRSGILRDLVEGRPMRCAGDRCSHCFIHSLCTAMQEAVGELERGVPHILRLDLEDRDAVRRADPLLGRPRDVLWIRARDVDEILRLEELGGAGSLGGRLLWLSLEDLRGLRDAVRMPDRIIVRDGARIEEAMELAPAEVLVDVNRSTQPFLDGLERRAGTRIVLTSRPAETLRAAAENDLDLAEALRSARSDAVVDVPPCLSGVDAVVYEDPFDASVIGEDGLVDPDRFVTHFIRRLYRTKSLRCARCVHDASCRGIPINAARARGLGILDPVEE